MIHSEVEIGVVRCAGDRIGAVVVVGDARYAKQRHIQIVSLDRPVAFRFRRLAPGGGDGNHAAVNSLDCARLRLAGRQVNEKAIPWLDVGCTVKLNGAPVHCTDAPADNTPGQFIRGHTNNFPYRRYIQAGIERHYLARPIRQQDPAPVAVCL